MPDISITLTPGVGGYNTTHELTFISRVIREVDGAIVDGISIPVTCKSGVPKTVVLTAGQWVVAGLHQGGNPIDRVSFTVGDTDETLWDLIEASLALPDDTPLEQLLEAAAAAAAAAATNTAVAAIVTADGPTKAALDGSYVRSVNGTGPDEDGNVTVSGGGGGGSTTNADVAGFVSSAGATRTAVDARVETVGDARYAPSTDDREIRAANFLAYLRRVRREHPPGVVLAAEDDAATAAGVWVDAADFMGTVGRCSGNVQPGSVIEPSIAGWAGFVKATGISESDTGGASYTIEFDYTGQQLDISMAMAYMQLTWFEIWVDGYLCASYPGTTATDGHNGFFNVSFPDARRRNIRIVRGNNWTQWIIDDGVGEFLDPSTRAGGPSVVVVGDSVTEGTGSGIYGYVETLGLMLGWDSVEGSGLGGTGYIADNAKVSIPDRLANDVTTREVKPDLCIIAAGYNDVDGVRTPAQIAAAAESTWSTVTGADIPLLVVGVWDSVPLSNPGQRAAQREADAALKAAAQSAGIPYVSPFDESWLGGNTDYLSGDNVHPNTAGHERIAAMLATHLA